MSQDKTRCCSPSQIVGFALQKFSCKPDQRTVKVSTDTGSLPAATHHDLCHCHVLLPIPPFDCEPNHLAPLSWTATPSSLHQGSGGGLGVRWQQRTWARGWRRLPVPYQALPTPPPPSVGGANLPWKRLRARSRHEALIRHSPEWVLRTINL